MFDSIKAIMKGRLIIEESLRDGLHVFKDRHDAGKRLTEKLKGYKNSDALLLAIPSGGVPVALEVAGSLNLPLDLILVRKIQLPWNTEAGFGAIDPDGNAIFNETLLNRLEWLTEDEIDSQVNKTRDILRKRNEIFRGDRAFPEIGNRTVIIIDDGLASGYTMLAALRFVRRRKPEKVIAAVPTASINTIEIVLSETDELICLNIRAGLSFAVADAYMYWHDLADNEVISMLEQISG
jgi:predicted phosphoribosyltransferase